MPGPAASGAMRGFSGATGRFVGELFNRRREERQAKRQDEVLAEQRAYNESAALKERYLASRAAEKEEIATYGAPLSEFPGMSPEERATKVRHSAATLAYMSTTGAADNDERLAAIGRMFGAATSAAGEAIKYMDEDEREDGGGYMGAYRLLMDDATKRAGIPLPPGLGPVVRTIEQDAQRYDAFIRDTLAGLEPNVAAEMAVGWQQQWMRDVKPKDEQFPPILQMVGEETYADVMGMPLDRGLQIAAIADVGRAMRGIQTQGVKGDLDRLYKKKADLARLAETAGTTDLEGLGAIERIKQSTKMLFEEFRLLGIGTYYKEIDPHAVKGDLKAMMASVIDQANFAIEAVDQEIFELEQVMATLEEQDAQALRAPGGAPQQAAPAPVAAPAPIPAGVDSVAMVRTTPLPEMIKKFKVLDPLVEPAANKYGVDPNLVRAVAMYESTGNIKEGNFQGRGDDGEYGVMQVLPATVDGLGGSRETAGDPGVSFDLGSKLLRENMDRYPGDWEKVLAQYNGGEAAAATSPPSNASYVENVLSIWKALGEMAQSGFVEGLFQQEGQARQRSQPALGIPQRAKQ